MDTVLDIISYYNDTHQIINLDLYQYQYKQINIKNEKVCLLKFEAWRNTLNLFFKINRITDYAYKNVNLEKTNTKNVIKVSIYPSEIKIKDKDIFYIKNTCIKDIIPYILYHNKTISLYNNYVDDYFD